MNERNPVVRDARTLGIPKMLLLGLQHMFAMFGEYYGSNVPLFRRNGYRQSGAMIP